MNRKLKELTLEKMTFKHACLKKEEIKVSSEIKDDKVIQDNS